MSHENTPPPGSASGHPGAEGPRAAETPAADAPAATAETDRLDRPTTDELPVVDAAAGGASTRRARFASWRRERPFAGGVLAVLSGLVLYFSGRLELDNFEIQLGIEGMQSTLLPVALVALGVLVLVQPQFRVFYGVITLAISVYSLLGVNLGGFGIGMVLGVVGGILAVSWLPRDRRSDVPAPPAETTSAPRSEAGAEDAELRELLPFDDEPAPGGCHAVVMAAVAVLAIGGAGGTGATATGVGGAPQAGSLSTEICWDPLDWIDSITCEGDEDAPEPSPSATDDAGGDDQAGDDQADDAGADGAADGAGDGASGTGDGADGSDGDAEDDAKSGGDGDDQAGDKGKGDADDDEDAPSEKEEAEEAVTKAAKLELGPCVRLTFGGEYDINLELPGDCGTPEDANVFSLDSELETRDLQLSLTDLNGIGLVNVPVTNDGPRRDALKLSVDAVKVPGFWLKTYVYSGDTVAGTITDADYVSMEGNAEMYISSVHANLPDGDDFAELGQQIADGASFVEILLAMTDARIGLMGATSDTQVWSGFREQVWED